MKTHLLILTTLSSISMAYSKPKISEELQLTNQPPGRRRKSITETTTPKFGLAWLFANTKRREEIERIRVIKKIRERKLTEIIDERIQKTFVLLEASRGEQRVEKGNKNKKRWRDDDGDQEENQSGRCKEIKPKEDWTNRKLESRDGDQIRLKCALKGVHHDVDFESFHIQWLHYPSVKSSKNKGDEVSDCERGLGAQEESRVIEIHRPNCKVYTDFPFDDLTRVTKDITCTSEINLDQVAINDTGIYVCRSKIGLKPILGSQHFNTSSAYEMSEKIFVRISRRDDYYPHKVVSLVISVALVIVVILLTVKKLMRRKLGWEPEAENYAPEWPNSVPARRIASAGSLFQSRSTLRRPSEPCIDEESDEDITSSDQSDYHLINHHPSFEVGGELVIATEVKTKQNNNS